MRTDRCSFAHAVLVAVAALSICAAAADGTQPSTKPAATSMVTVTDAESGKDVDLASGQTLQVKLKMVAGTGYAWTVEGDPAPLKLAKTSKQQLHPGKPGAQQLAVFTFSPSSAGMATLTMVYRRSWEYNVPPAKTFTLRVNVREGIPCCVSRRPVCGRIRRNVLVTVLQQPSTMFVTIRKLMVCSTAGINSRLVHASQTGVTLDIAC
jgi:predicted secreted protein